MPQVNETVARVHQARQSVHRTFKTKWEQMQQNSEFIRLLQYSSDQLKKMDEQKRVPYVLDFLNSAMNTFQGIQRDRRTEIFYYGQEPGDEVKCEVLNAVKDSTLQQNNFIYKESDVFQDGLIQKLGAVEFEWSKEKNKNGALNILVIPPRQLMWDLNCNEFDKSDCTWMSRYRLFGKRELENRYPDRVKDIDQMPFFAGEDFDDLGITNRDYLETILDIELGALALVEFWEKKYETRWFIQDKTTGFIEGLYYDSEKDADKEIREMIQKSEAMFVAQGVQPPESTLKSFSDKFPVISKSEVAGELAFMEEETIEEPFYPISYYHPFWVDRDWYSPIDVVKDGQRYFNKMFSMADHWIGTQSKGLILYNESRVDLVVAQRVKDAFNGTGGMVGVPDIEDFKEFKSQGPAPQLFSLLDLAHNQIVENSGGKNFQGRKETASESGVAVRQRIEQGGLAGFVIYDNLRRWKMDVGQKMAWYLTHYMTYPTVMRIEGEELVQETMQKFNQVNAGNWFKAHEIRPGIGYLQVNTESKNTIENLMVDTIVDEARWSISKNQSILQEISIAMQSNPNMAQVFPPKTMVHFMNFPFSVKQEALREMDRMQKQLEQRQQMELQKPPTVSASLGDAEKLPPEAFAEFMQKFFGIQLDPSQVQNPDVLKTKMDAAKSVMQMHLDKEKHNQQMQMESEKHQQTIVQKTQDMQMRAMEGARDFVQNHAAGEQKLSHAERTQQLKEKNNAVQE
jgi:hypothetical protein